MQVVQLAAGLAHGCPFWTRLSGIVHSFVNMSVPACCWQVRAVVHPPTVDEARCAAVVLAGLHCNLPVEHTSVATLRRSALVQILERFAMPPKKRPAAAKPEDGVDRSFLDSCWKPVLLQGAGAKNC